MSIMRFCGLTEGDVCGKRRKNDAATNTMDASMVHGAHSGLQEE